MNPGQNLWKRAKTLTLGSNMRLLKLAEIFLHEHWSGCASKTMRCQVWDSDGKQGTNICIMGIGTKTLGHGQPQLHANLMATMQADSIAYLNWLVGVYLAKRKVEMPLPADVVSNQGLTKPLSANKGAV